MRENPPPLMREWPPVNLAQATTHVDFYARNVRRGLRGQERYRRGYFLGLTGYDAASFSIESLQTIYEPFSRDLWFWASNESRTGET